MKVIDNESLKTSKQLLSAHNEIEILDVLRHPFLPTLYAHFTTSKFTCLLMDYCSGGDLHVLRQKQLMKHTSEKAARFYVAEVVVALEYLHTLGVVHRDLKPENILIGEDGHIVLSDFNLSMKLTASPLQIEPPGQNCMDKRKNSGPRCMNHFCLQSSSQLPCFSPCFATAPASVTKEAKPEAAPGIIPLAPSNSIVGTHEYLAPEIIKGEGYGFSVDWWALGILMYELLYGESPFKGATDKDTINNVILQSIKFPKSPAVSSHVRDLITRLLNKDPRCRLGSAHDAVEIKQHPFFHGLNWALIREQIPPFPFC